MIKSEENRMTRTSPEHPSWYPTADGNLLSRTNLLRWIREWARAHEITEFDYFEFGVLNGESIVDAIRQLRGDSNLSLALTRFAESRIFKMTISTQRISHRVSVQAPILA